MTYDTDDLVNILTTQRNQALDQWAMASAVNAQLQKQIKTLTDEVAALKPKEAANGPA